MTELKPGPIEDWTWFRILAPGRPNRCLTETGLDFTFLVVVILNCLLTCLIV
jgi:hypothetical protein